MYKRSVVRVQHSVARKVELAGQVPKSPDTCARTGAYSASRR